MKQTNSAIKFLMAQYRAIFKNANLKMFLAATAAAVALSSGAAQAADPAGTNVDPIPSYGNELKDSVLNADEKIEHTGVFIVLDAPEGKPIVINGGTIANYKDTAQATGHIFTANDLILNDGTISLKKHTGHNVGLVGMANDTFVPSSALTVNGGNFKVDGSFALMGQVVLAGGTTDVGGYTVKQDTEDFANYAMIYSTAKPLVITGDAKVNLNEASGLFGYNVQINGGTINFNGKDKVVTDNSSTASGAFIRTGKKSREDVITITGGEINVLAGRHGGLYGEKIVMKGGAVDVKDGGTLTLGNNLYHPERDTDIEVNGGSVTVGKASKLIIEGDASFADGTLKNGGTIDYGTLAEGASRELTVGANDFNKNLFKATEAKITVSGTDSSSSGTNGNESFDINVTGNEAVDLIGSGLLTTEGALNTNKLSYNDEIESSITAKNAAIGAANYSADVGLVLDTLTAGKDGSFTIKSGSKILVKNALTVTPKEDKSDLTINGSLFLLGNTGSINANNIVLTKDASSDASLNVYQSRWTAKNLTITDGVANVYGDKAVLTLTGNLKNQAADQINVAQGATLDASNGVLKLVSGGVSLTEGSTLVLDSADVFSIAEDGTVSLTTGTKDTESTFAKESVKTDDTSILKIKHNGNLTVEQLKSVRDAIADTSTPASSTFHGFLNLAGANITNRPHEDIDLSNANFMERIDGLYNNVAVTVGAGGSVNKSFTAGQLKLTDANDSKANIESGTSVMLTGSKGDFVVKSGGGVADVSLASGASLVLAGNGSIGAITGAGADSGSVVIGHSSLGHGTVSAKAIGDASNSVGSVEVAGSNLNVAGAVNTGKLSLDGHSSLNITADAGSGSITAKTLNVGDDASINAAGQAITVGTTANNTDVAKILGNVTAESITIAGSGSHSIAGNATVTLNKLDLGSDPTNVSTLSVGTDDPNVNGSATVITKSLVGIGKLVVDPVYSEKAALVIAESLDAPSKPVEKDAGTLRGKAVVGNNAALGIGFKSEAELNDVIGQYLNAHGAFTEMPADGQLANALVLNKRISIESGDGITLQKGADTSTNPTGDTLTLGAGTGIVITDNAFDVDPTTGAKTNAAIKFLAAGGAGTVTANGGQIILSGNFDDKDDNLEIFSGVNNISNSITVTSANGLLTGSIAAVTSATGGKTDLTFQEEKAKALFAGVSAPAQKLLLDTLKGEYKTKKGVGTDFVYTVANTSMNAVELDAVLHAATYAGAQQAAVAAVGTMAEAVAGRVGSTGVETTVLAATGAEGHGGVWVTPMYKSVNSDGFNAQGASYGSDVDLAGVTFGVDSVRGNMRFGAAFNIGSGDSEGKGNGNGLKDEFDYYGFGIYTAMNFNHCSLIADASVNVISHDVEGYSGHQEFGTLGASADTTAVTLGVTGQYTHATEFVDVTPHVGMRFTRLDTDSYDLNSAKGVLANTDFDVQNVFSIPVGVTLSKTFEHNGWAYSPAADFTLTFNTGDTEVDSTTHLNDMTNVALNTEVLDEVTYGLNLGFSAQNGSFGTSVNVSYAGSENSDSVGINANARYMF